MSITIKSAEDIEGMRLACRLASEVLDYIAPHIKPGITTKEIDRLGAAPLLGPDQPALPDASSEAAIYQTLLAADALHARA